MPQLAYLRRVTLGLALGVLLLMGVAVAESPGNVSSNRWTYEDTEDGVALWASATGRSSLGATKVVTRFALRPEALLAALRDVPSYPRWYRDCAQTRILRAPTQLEPVVLDAQGKFIMRALHESYVLFFLQRASMLDDRWAILENTSRVRRDGSLAIAFRSLDNYPYRGPQGAVRMGVSGEWVLTPIDREHTQVGYIVDLDLKASVPDFLVRPRIHEAARKTLLALGNIARQKYATTPAQVR